MASFLSIDKGCAIGTLRNERPRLDTLDQPTQVFSCIDLTFASTPNIICNLGVELSLFDKCHNLLFQGN